MSLNVDKKTDFARATVRGTFWTYAARYSGKLLTFVSMIILARLLTQEDFGIVGYAFIVTNFLDVFRSFGVGSALIYHHENSEAPYTAFWLSIGTGILLFAITWLAAPAVGAFFNDDRVIPVVRVLALTFPISTIGSIHSALLRRNLAFGRKFIPDVANSAAKGITSITLALLGFGVWSLVFGQIVSVAIAVIAYWWVISWRPAFRFSRNLVRPLLSFGMSMVSLAIISHLIANVDYLLIGRYLGAASLGVYTLAFRIPEMLIIQFCTVVGLVLFPVYSKMRDDTSELNQAFLVTMRSVSMITIPIGLGLAIVAEPFVLTFFTEKWAEVIPVLRAIAIYAMILSLSYNVGSVYKAQGRPGLLTQLAIVRGVILFPVMWLVVAWTSSIVMVGWVHAGVALLTGILNLTVAGKMLKTPFSRMITTLRPAAISGLIMAIGVIGVMQLSEGMAPIIQLSLGVLAGVTFYVAALWWQQQQLIVQAGQTLRAALNRR